MSSSKVLLSRLDLRPNFAALRGLLQGHIAPFIDWSHVVEDQTIMVLEKLVGNVQCLVDIGAEAEARGKGKSSASQELCSRDWETCTR